MADRHLVDVHVLLLREDKVLLTQPKGGQWDGMWHLPSGKLDAGEPATTAAAREADEEVGVLINPSDLTCVHTIHVHGSYPGRHTQAEHVSTGPADAGMSRR